MIDKKELKARYSDNGLSLVEIYYEGGGQVPNRLLGKYTSMTLAQKAIKIYQSNEVK